MAVKEEDVVITGFSARFPQADSLAEFKEKLYAGIDFVTDDEMRWPRGHLGLPERMGKIRDLSLFDAEFFGVPPRQAHSMDPQMRLLMETSYEAIVDSGYDPATLRGRRVGVFIGCNNCESHEAFSFDADNNDGYGLVGSSLSMLASRITHSFDFQGLSMAVDSGCSSTMAALNQAVLSIRYGLCEAAVVGGSALCLKPASSLGFLRLGMLSPEGKCMTFDSRANGYVRSETVGVFFVQRTSEARRIYAKITHIKSLSDGYTSEGITFPSKEAQERLLRDVYEEAHVDPRKVDYVEAHGTGTQVGDSQELCSISNVFCQPGREKPLKVGAVKSNVGHGEPACGISSLAKVILAMETGVIAANLHFREPNPNIACLRDGSVKVVAELTPFLGGPVGINSFGLGGSSVHVILEPREGPHVEGIARNQAHLPRLVLVAGRSQGSLMRTLDRLEEEGPHADSAYALLNRVGQPSVKHFPYRGFALVSVDGSSNEVVKVAERVTSEKRPLWFVFTGMGCQWTAMARQMMQLEVFARSIRKSHEVLRAFGIDLIDIMTKDNGSGHCMASVQASIIAAQVALVDTLAAVGIHPDGMVGHSVGEIGCAYADGCLTHEQAVLCAYWRGRSIDTGQLPSGAMAALGLSWEEAAKRCPDGVVPACHNAADSVTVSGPKHAVAALVEELCAEGAFVREVDSANVAFHSQHMKLVAPAFLDAVQKIVPVPKPRSKRWVTSSVPESLWHEPAAQHCSADFLVENLVAPVLFYEALSHVPKNAILVEIGPHCILQPILRRALGTDASPLGLMNRDDDNLSFFLKSLGKLHTLGIQLHLSPLYPPVPFPVPRGTPSIGHLVSWDHSQRWTVAKWNEFAGSKQLSEDVVDINVDSNDGDAYLAGHQLDGRVIFPAAGYMVLAWKSLTKRSGKPFHKVPVVFEDINFHRTTILPKSGTVRFKVQVMSASGDFEVSEGCTLVASGRIRVAEEGEEILGKSTPGPLVEAVPCELDTEEIYKDLRLRGYGYSGSFKSILKADLHKPHGKLMWTDNWVTFIDSMLQFCAFNDPLRAFRQFARLESCRIDPQFHAQVEQDVGLKGIPVLYDRCLNTCSAGGVAFRGIHADIVARGGVKQTPCLEEYRFIPYVDDETIIQEREARLKEYVCVCSTIARRILVASADEMHHIPGLLNDSYESTEEMLNQYRKSTRGNNGLLRVLLAIQTKVNDSSSSLASAVQWALTTHKNDLDQDILHTALLEEDPLRPLLDVAVENTAGKKIRVLEMAFTGSKFLLTPWVSKLLPLSNMLLKIEYAVAHPCPNELKPQRLPEDIVRHLWDPTSNSVKELPDAQLVVVRVPLTSPVRLEVVAEKLSRHCKEHAFALLLLPTALPPAGVFLSKVGNIETTIHTKEKAMSVLRTCGFRSVGVKSNKWSTLLLLRKMSALADTTKQEMIAVENTTFGWVETLKAKLIEGKSKPEGLNLSLIGKDSGISGVVGLVNCLRQEATTGHVRARCIFDASLSKSEEATDAALSDQEYRRVLERNLLVNVQRNGHWGSFRHLTIGSRGAPKRLTGYAFLNVPIQGDLTRLQWYESPLRYGLPSSSSGKVLCSVYYAAVNFRDVMIATGKLPSGALPDAVATSECLLGLEFSGREPQGRRVMGLVPSQGMATSVVVDPELLWEVPDAWSLEEASTVPLAYSTAYYTLLVRGNMQPGESLLIQSGSGDVGQAAISIALSMGCTVFTTVGSQEEREFLRQRFQQLKVENISSSRDLSFEELVLRETNGRGVDLVLNSMCEEKVQVSVRCLALHGRFLEIGKFHLSKDPSLGKSALVRGISFHSIVPERLHSSCLSTEKDKRRVRALVREGITAGAVRPLVAKRFARDQAEEAFRFVASGKHVGKVLLEIRPEESTRMTCLASPLTVEAVARTYFYKHKSYVIVGGLGGVGLELAGWMVRRGCRRLLLTSRSGVQNGYQKLCLRRWERTGAVVLVVKADVTADDAARQIIRTASVMGPVGGIFNLAMVLSIAFFEHQTAESFERVCKPKADGTRMLDELSRKLCPELDHFVVFSSLSCGRGVVGQTNYGYANSVMERICEQRVADGLPGLAIQWGPIGDVGVLHELLGGDVEFDGCAPQRISSCLEVLDHLLNQSQPVVSSLVKAEHSAKHGQKGSKTRDLAQTVAHIFGVKEPSNINPNLSLSELGMDSLMGVAVRRALEQEHGFTLSVLEIRRLTFARLREMSRVESVAGSDSTAA
ncbi:fatty acid synthase-like [Amblyomma americanum]